MVMTKNGQNVKDEIIWNNNYDTKLTGNTVRVIAYAVEWRLLQLRHCSLWTCDPHSMYNFLGGPHKGRSDPSDETKLHEGKKVLTHSYYTL